MSALAASRLVFHEARHVAMESFDVPAPGPGEVRVRTEYSLLSTGTETIVYNRNFDAGTHWADWVKYPFHPGYAAVGVVESVGGGVTAHAVGDRVVLRSGHAALHTVPESKCWPVPAGIPAEKAVWFALAKIAAMGARTAEHRLGERIAVIGAGPIGQMALRWAAATGPRTLAVIDPVVLRLRLASQGGATAVIDQPVEAAREALLRAGNGELPDLVLDTTGNAHVFRQALALARNHGRVLLLGDTGSPDSQHLTPDVIIRGVRIAGAHDGHEDATWNTANITSLFFSLVQTGRFSLDQLNTHEFQPTQARDAYELASHRRAETMGILFNWQA